MNTPKYHSDVILKCLTENKIATITELKEALGTRSDATAYRRLREIPHCTSYSHRGRFHTLPEIAQFDEFGLWSFLDVRFSRHGTLLSSIETLVQDAPSGYFAAELTRLLQVSIKVAVLKLFRENRLSRERVSGLYLYCSHEPARKREQLLARRLAEIDPNPDGLAVVDAPGRLAPDELKAAIVLFFSLLDEQQRRLYAGLEAIKIGHGGDRRIADLLGLDPGTVSIGRRQLLEHDALVGRARAAGGGRHMTEKKPLK